MRYPLAHARPGRVQVSAAIPADLHSHCQSATGDGYTMSDLIRDAIAGYVAQRQPDVKQILQTLPAERLLDEIARRLNIQPTPPTH